MTTTPGPRPATPTSPLLGFHASHEQLAPGDLLLAVQAAEAAGFDGAMCSDHFAPWTGAQGHSGAAWPWLGAALQATRFTIGVVTAPGQRYHPAVVAQQIATLAQMYPGRFWAALGSGEHLNEHITGHAWPPKPDRDHRLAECAGVIASLLAGEEVTHDGRVQVHRARLWTLPDVPPRILAAAVTARTAAAVAAWADGLITVNQPLDDLRATIDAFRANGGEGKPVAVQMHVSWATTEGEAVAIAHEQWRCGLVRPPLAWELAFPDDFERATAAASPADVTAVVNVSSDPSRHAGWIADVVELGASAVYLHHVGREQRPFIETFATEVLPRCRR